MLGLSRILLGVMKEGSWHLLTYQSSHGDAVVGTYYPI